MTKKEILKDIDRRIGNGEPKKTIYSSYAMTEWESLAVKKLALSVTMNSRKKWRRLNNVLVAVYAFMLLLNIFGAWGLLGVTSFPERLGGMIGVAIGLTINVLVLVGLIRYNIIAHYALIFLSINGMTKLLEPAGHGDVAAIFMVALLAASIALAGILFRKLLPNTSFLLKPKTDTLGCPVFEE